KLPASQQPPVGWMRMPLARLLHPSRPLIHSSRSPHLRLRLLPRYRFRERGGGGSRSQKSIEKSFNPLTFLSIGSHTTLFSAQPYSAGAAGLISSSGFFILTTSTTIPL